VLDREIVFPLALGVALGFSGILVSDHPNAAGVRHYRGSIHSEQYPRKLTYVSRARSEHEEESLGRSTHQSSRFNLGGRWIAFFSV
jgi:hypothetical protein